MLVSLPGQGKNRLLYKITHFARLSNESCAMVSPFSRARNCISDSTENPCEVRQATFRAFLDKARNPLCESLTCTPDPHFVKVLNTRCPHERWRGILLCLQHRSITGDLLEAVTTEEACIQRGHNLIDENHGCPIRR